jgi:hypothetical protein
MRSRKLGEADGGEINIKQKLNKNKIRNAKKKKSEKQKQISKV